MNKQRSKSAFTLVEVLVSVSVLVLMLTIVAEMMTRTQDTITKANSHVREFQEARRVLDSLSNSLSQATMDAVWAYEYSSSDPSSINGYNLVSDHHFILASSSELLPPEIEPEAGQAVFFQAPLGSVSQSDKRRLHDLVNCTGYYVEYGSDYNERPGFLTTDSGLQLNPERQRFRLMRYLQPAENSRLYGDTTLLGLNKLRDRKKAFQWFQTDMGTASAPLADNILALVLTPYVKTMSGDDVIISADPDYFYDSRDFQWNDVTPANQTRRHRLPVKVGITLIAADERSYDSLVSKLGAPAAAEAVREVLKDRFTDHHKLQEDLDAVEEGLGKLPLHHKVLSAMVALRSSN